MLSALVGAGVSKAPVLQRAWDLARKRHIRLNLEVVVAVKKCQGLILGKIDDKRRRQQVMRQLDSITDSMDMNLSKLQEIVKDRKDRCAAAHGVAKNRIQASLTKKP